MSRPSIAVQHCVLTTLTRQHGSRPVFDLLEVQYEYAVPADTEFPYFVPKFDLFLRVIARSAGIVGYRFRVRRRIGRGQWDAPGDYNSPANVLVFPTNRTVVFSHSFRLPNVRLTGTGLYAVTVFFRPRRSRWQLAAVEYFRVVR